jgi:signal peptidase II
MPAMPHGGRVGDGVSIPALDRPRDTAVASRAPSHAAMLVLVALPVLGIDQLSKYLVSAHIELYRSIPLIPGWLDLTYTLNPGAAFSLFATMPPAFRHVFFISLSVVAAVVLTVLIVRRGTARLSAFAFALILGGALGNLIDRLARGVVTDFIYFHHASFSYPVFNIADSAITIGVAILMVSTLFATAPAELPKHVSSDV